MEESLSLVKQYQKKKMMTFKDKAKSRVDLKQSHELNDAKSEDEELDFTVFKAHTTTK